MKCLFCRFMSILGLTITLFSACRSKEHNAESVEQAMQKYNRYILKMDVDSIALLYTPDGELGKMARGRDSIRRFLENFKKYKVLSQVSKTNLINIQQGYRFTIRIIYPKSDRACKRYCHCEGFVFNQMDLDGFNGLAYSADGNHTVTWFLF